MKRSITLWGAGTARTLRPIWVAEELGLQYDLKPIGPRTGETSTPEFAALNRRQKIPVLVDGDFSLSESLAICRYLIHRYPGESVYRPTSVEECAREDEWCSHIYGELDETSLYVMRRHGDLGHIYGSAPNVVEASKEYATRHLRAIEDMLGDRSSVLDGGFGLADVMLQTCLEWAVTYGVELPSGLDRYRHRIAARKAFQRAVTLNFGGG